MFKILTLVGTRPELIRLSIIINKLDQMLQGNHILVDTCQNRQHNLSGQFYKEFEIRKPNYSNIGFKFTKELGSQIGMNFNLIQTVVEKEKPDKALILGDTNTSLSAIMLERMGIPVYHMEAGNRCFDKKVPEEVNRRMIDAVSSYNMPYTQHSKQHLINEGKPENQIFVTGNPIYEVYMQYQLKILILSYALFNIDFLVTCHRAETVDNCQRFTELIDALNLLAKDGYHLVYPIHPRAQDKMNQFNLKLHSKIKVIEPVGYLDFCAALLKAKCVITDSGTVQEEACIMKTPAVIIRNSTERPETLECGASRLTGLNKNLIYTTAIEMINYETNWDFPEGYQVSNVSNIVVNYLMGYQL